LTGIEEDGKYIEFHHTHIKNLCVHINDDDRKRRSESDGRRVSKMKRKIKNIQLLKVFNLPIAFQQFSGRFWRVAA
jgi:hypothetical protein